MGTDTSAINDKKEDSKPSHSSKNNWKAFGGAVVGSFVQVMVLGIVGANMLYVLSPSSLKLLFPDDTNKRPYTSDGPSLFPKWSQQSGGGEGDADINSHVDSMTKKAKEAVDSLSADKNKQSSTSKTKAVPDLCGLDVDPLSQSHIFKSPQVRGLYDYGFPYYWKYTKDSANRSVLGFLKNWVGYNTQQSYSGLRGFLKKIFGFLEISCQLNEQAKWRTLPIFIFAPFIFFALLFITQLWSIPTVLYYMIFNHESWKDLLFTILGLFFHWTSFLVGSISFSQSFGIIFTLLFLPIIADPKRVMKIIGKRYHSLYLFIIFLLLVTSNAFTYLTADVATAMFVPFIIAIISSIIHVVRKQ